MQNDSSIGVPVVLHFRNGSTSHVHAPPEIERERETVVIVRDDHSREEVPFSDLKAIFYLRDESSGGEQMVIDEKAAKSLVVEFRDGERIRGHSYEYAPGRNGFFLFPADRSKNDRIFVVNSAIVSIEVDRL